VSAAVTYAEALYEAAAAASAVTPVAEDVAGIAGAVRESDELRAALSNPEIDSTAKKRIVEAVADGAHPLVLNFLRVLADRGRLGDLPEIAEAVAARVGRAENRIDVEAVTAVPLPADLRERIVEQIRATTGADVVLTESVDPEIVGGLVLRVGGAVVDGSVRHRIESLRQNLRRAHVDAVAADAA
jgi:F-type H+-transporting ATPase subunit delta